MTIVTGDDIRVLARSNEDQPVLVVVGDQVAVVPTDQADANTIVYTRADLVDEFGDQLHDIDADLLASSLTARLAEEGLQP